eukprot:7424-Chlamydomonas_euryale.AAC.1
MAPPSFGQPTPPSSPISPSAPAVRTRSTKPAPPPPHSAASHSAPVLRLWLSAALLAVTLLLAGAWAVLDAFTHYSLPGLAGNAALLMVSRSGLQLRGVDGGHGASAGDDSVLPLAALSHNDEVQREPLFGALRAGVAVVEADAYLVENGGG